jgi:Ni,Fe-hydrogenase III small subunit
LDDIIVQTGGVVVYLSFDNGTNYEAIPEAFGGVAYGTVHSKGQVVVDLRSTSGGTITAPIGQILAKVVLLDAKPL